MQPGRPPLPPGTVLAGKFRVVKPLGQGGMGAVYVVEHVITRHERALKILHPEMAANREVVERFLREASAAGHIGSEHIVETFDAGTLETGAPYIVMELLKGETLSDRLLRGDLGLDELSEIFRQACAGVQAAHDAGIVHRDLKPENLFVAERDGRPFVKILDFGISKFDPTRSGELSVTREGAALGTPYYMSPEQILGSRAVDHRTDVYALGVVLYECLTRKRPFEAETLPMLTVRIHEGHYVPVSALRPGLPSAVDAVIQRALARQPEERFQGVSDLAAAFAGVPALARGSIAFEKTAISGPPPADPGLQSAVRAESAFGDPKLATSALGVSVRSPGTSGAPRGRSGLAVGLGVALAAVAAVSVGLVLASRSSPSEAPGAAPEPPHRAAATPAAPVTASPAPVMPPPLPLEAPSAVASAAPRPGAATAKGPSKERPGAAGGAPHSVTSAEPRKPSRSQSESLATENPFR
jgi:eukaryotic-like serine/threonine-protein kinase